MFHQEEFPSRRRAKCDLGERLRQVRVEIYGKDGAPELAHILGLPEQSWSNYENGVTIPGDVLLELLVLTYVEPRWLLRGEGEKFRLPAGDVDDQQNSENTKPSAGRRATIA
jgi:hypothetical protein